VKNDENCPFLMINIKNEFELFLYFKKEISENPPKNSPRHSPAIPGKVPILSKVPSK